MAFIIAFDNSRFWPKLGGKLNKEKLRSGMDITQETRTYSLKQVVQLTNGLLLLPLYATSPDSRTIDGPFAPDGSAILYSLLDGCV